MAAYLIAEHKITDPARFTEYLSKVVPLLERYGAKYLTKAGSHQIIDGDWRPDRVVVVEFPDMERLKKFFASPEYQPLIEIRHGTGPEVLIALDGA